MAGVVTVPADSSAAPSTRPSGPAPGRRWSRYAVETRVLGVLRWVVIVGLMLFTLFPFYYMALLSLRDLSALLQDPGRLWPALSEFTAATYREVLASTASGGQGFLRLIANSGLIALGTVALTLAFAVPGAYAIARLAFPGRRTVGVLFLAVYLFPGILLAVPLFVFFTRIGLRGSLAALVLVYVSQTVAVAIYTLRSHFQTVPASIEEAAAVDGAGPWRQLWRITVPMIQPVVVFTVILSTIGGLQLFNEPMLFDENPAAASGGSNGQYQTIAQLIYKVGWKDLNLGYAAAMSWALFLIILVVALVNAVATNRLGGGKR